jgi:hypothetical protein
MTTAMNSLQAIFSETLEYMGQWVKRKVTAKGKAEAYKPLGIKWELLGGTWGGRFNDGNHFSLAHNNIK